MMEMNKIIKLVAALGLFAAGPLAHAHGACPTTTIPASVWDNGKHCCFTRHTNVGGERVCNGQCPDGMIFSVNGGCQKDPAQSGGSGGGGGSHKHKHHHKKHKD